MRSQKLSVDTISKIALDGGDGNLKFFSGMRGLRVFATAWMLNDRELSVDRRELTKSSFASL
jgi:hypothetical protein